MRRNQHTLEEQREMAINAAELLLVQHGIQGISMRKVAQAIGYAVGQLYKVFTDQDELLLAISERTAAALLDSLRTARMGQSQAEARLHAVSQAYIGFSQRYPHRWRLLFSHRIAPQTAVPQSNVHKAQMLFALVEELLTDYAPDLRNGALRETATALWAGVHGIAALAVDDKLSWSERDDPALICERLVRTFLAGVERPAPV